MTVEWSYERPMCPDRAREAFGVKLMLSIIERVMRNYEKKGMM